MCSVKAYNLSTQKSWGRSIIHLRPASATKKILFLKSKETVVEIEKDIYMERVFFPCLNWCLFRNCQGDGQTTVGISSLLVVPGLNSGRQGPWLTEPFCWLTWFPKSLWILREHDGSFFPWTVISHFMSCLLWRVFWCALFDQASLSLLKQPGSRTGGATTWCQTLCKPNWHSTGQACAAVSGYGRGVIPRRALHPGLHRQRSYVVFRETQALSLKMVPSYCSTVLLWRKVIV